MRELLLIGLLAVAGALVATGVALVALPVALIVAGAELAALALFALAGDGDATAVEVDE